MNKLKSTKQYIIPILVGVWSVILFFDSCKNELIVNSDYKETVVIFGLLDASQSKQYIKINKAFLTNQQSVAEVAQIQDSIYFSNIKAELYEEQTKKVIPLTAENVSNKKPGLFLNEPNFLYTTTETIFPQYDYQIRVENLNSGIKADARTSVVDPSVIFSPTTGFDSEYNLSNGSNAVISVFIKAGNDVNLYDVILDFTYEEYNQFDTSTKVTKNIRWKIMDSKPVSPQENVKSNLSTDLFFDLLSAQIEVRKDWVRRAKGFQFTYIGGGEELKNYISVSKPSIGIVQKQTEYTNIRNGLGVFSSRFTFVSKFLPPSSGTHLALSTEPKTAALGF